ncbi:MAG TPA: serine/threonine-protein kinase, partial [Vicinamibacteria bacterium]|nr:serine/threonine-protein kinase [Vicinamibacteria bacterium]
GPGRPLRPGQRLGRYEIRGLLGSGGMSRVYRALDPVLGREVAIKALAEAFRDDAASLRRFEREARALANLNHPNVATIHGFELLDDAPYLVLELVEGITLEERLREGALPLRAALDVARQVAEALEEAHRKGVVHRDLKPSNVMLGPGGRVKVLDFGVAKTVVRRDGGPPAIPHTATAPGEVLGTAPYMSPEQVRGDEVDARTDVWGFGCLLYEMLCGRRAFPGRSIPGILAAVLRDEIDWSPLPANTPQALRRVLQRCLRKDRHQRLQDVGDARLELEELGEEPASVAPRAASRAWPRSLPWIVAAAALISTAVLALRRPPAEPHQRPGLRLSLDLPAGFAIPDDYAAPFAISPDGSRVVVLGQAGPDEPSRLFVRDLRSLELVPLAG